LLNNVFVELSLVLVIAVIVSGIMRILKQPLIIGHIATGILVSPLLLNLVKPGNETFEAFAHMGVAILLFMVGLHLNPKAVKDVGKIALITGIGQIIFTSVIGFLIIKTLGFATIPAIYIAIALTFSSTIIILKLLSDKGDVDTLYGRIAIGFLIVQDIVAMFILMLISSSTGTAGLSLIVIIEIIIKLITILVGVFIIAKLIFPLITEKIAKSQEFLLFFAIAWCFIVATIFEKLNFSIEAGALLAGVALSMSPLKYEISSKLKPLRDFFILLFFVWLGSQMVFSNITQFIWPIIILSIFVLIGNPLIVLILMGAQGYSKRNALFSGFTVAQISEFSLILIGLGVTVGHLTGEILSLVTFIGIITISGSTYLIIYNKKIYELLSPYLSIFEKKKTSEKNQEQNKKMHEVILFGYNRIGFDLAESLTKMKKTFLVIDNNPDTVKEVTKQGINSIYGDADNREFLSEINLSKTKMIISTIPDPETNHVLIKTLKEINPKAIKIVVANQIDTALELYETGADYVIMPHMLGGKHTSQLLQETKFKKDLILKEKLNHLRHIEKRKKYKELKSNINKEQA